MRYRAEPPPLDPNELPDYLQRELQRISNSIDSLVEMRLEVLAEEPPRPRDGDIRFADGANWDPGEGRGTYERAGGEWRRFYSPRLVAPGQGSGLIIPLGVSYEMQVGLYTDAASTDGGWNYYTVGFHRDFASVPTVLANFYHADPTANQGRQFRGLQVGDVTVSDFVAHFEDLSTGSGLDGFSWVAVGETVQE